MVLHQVVPVLVLALFDLMDFDLHPELQLLLEVLEFELIAANQIFFLQFKLRDESINIIL